MKYFVPVGEFVEQVKSILEGRLKAGKLAEQLVKRVGASNFAYTPSDFKIIGFQFDKPPDAKLWKHLKRSDVWVPKKGAAKDLHEEMTSIGHDTKDQIYKLLNFGGVGKGGLKIIADGNGIRLPLLGWTQSKDGGLIFHTTDAKTLRGCKRISDIEYEKLRKFKD